MCRLRFLSARLRVEQFLRWTVFVSVASTSLVCPALPAGAADPPREPAVASAAKDPAPSAKLIESQLFRVLADLVEAKAADRPDSSRIDKLTQQLQDLVQQLATARSRELSASSEAIEAAVPPVSPQVTSPASGRRGPPWARGSAPEAGHGGFGPGRGGPGMASDNSFVHDRDTFHFLLSHRDSITREVKNIADGIETLTEADDPEVVTRLKDHVQAMYARVKEGRPIHMRDPLFAALFRHADKIRMELELTPSGARVREVSADPYVARLIQAHAEVVNKFLANGFDEVHRNHQVPAKSG